MRPQRDLDRLAAQGKMRPRERLELLLDPGTFRSSNLQPRR
ncbi:MAG: hypothetical protein WDN69_14125 [Aliidongia sp.]